MISFNQFLVEEKIDIDNKIKEQLAKDNGIDNYISIDCSKSECSYIKISIIESGLLNILHTKESSINWAISFCYLVLVIRYVFISAYYYLYYYTVII